MSRKRLFFGTGFPYLSFENVPGKLVVLEGADYAGCSTQIDLLKQWLEVEGHAVLDTGLRHATFVSDAIEDAKKGNLLGKTTLSLLYATDCADEMENQILPALKAGFVVLVDRYIFTLMARDLVRGAEKGWLQDLFGFAVVPDLVVYLQVDPQQLLHRGLAKIGRLDYWESGMDLGLSTDVFESFNKYQRRLQVVYDQMAAEYGFEIVDGSQDVFTIQRIIRDKVHRILA